MSIKITKGKVLNDGKLIIIDYTKTGKDKTSTHITEEHRSEAHPDLVNAFRALAIHAAILAEFISVKEVPDIKNVPAELVENFRVTGYSISEKDDVEAVILTGGKLLKSGKYLMFNTPRTLFEENPDSQYKYIDDLIEKLENCDSELDELMKGKVKPPVQQELGFKEANAAEMQVAGKEEEEDQLGDFS